MIHCDTSFVVHFLRETSRDDPGPATALLDSLPPEDLAVSVFAVCELLAGAALAQRGAAKLDNTLQIEMPAI